MKKEFLDIIYDLRGRVDADINRLVQNSQNPQSQCSKCELGSGDILMAELRTRRSQLSSIDDTIKDYIRIHGAVAG